MGLLKGVARVDGKRAVDGMMTFALGPRQAESIDLDGSPG
jgi:hypothetical protein